MLAWEGRDPASAPAADLSAPRAAAEPRGAARHAARDRRPRRPRSRADGLEFADTRAFVPGDRLRSVNWRASARRGELIVNERHPDRNADVVLFLDSFAEARGGDEDGRHARARGSGGGDARRAVPRAPRPRRARHVRRHPPLARARRRSRPALPPDRRAARDRGRVQLRLEGRQHHPGADAAAEGARDRGDAAARRALDRGAPRPPRPRTRPRDRRGLARGHRRAGRRPRRARLPPLAAAACRAAGALRALRRRGRALERASFRSTPGSRG